MKKLCYTLKIRVSVQKHGSVGIIMLKIAVCDDEKEVITQLTCKVQERLDASKLPYAPVMGYTDGEALLEAMQETNYDLILLDIEMSGQSGLEVARTIQMDYEDTKVIFVTNREDLVYCSFQYHPFWYVPKNMLDVILSDALDAFCKSVASRYQVVQVGELKKCVHDIAYMEKQGHYLIVHNANGTSERVRVAISQMEELLSPYCFIRCHIGYLVNPEYIEEIGKESICLENGENIPISRRKHQYTKEMYAMFI